MVISEFKAALNHLASERNITVEDVISTLKEAVSAAYRKDHEVLEDDLKKLNVRVNEETGEIKVFMEDTDVTPIGFGRIASQTAKQVILQKVREAEKESIASKYKEQIGLVAQGYIFRIDREGVIMDLGKTQGIMPVSEQIPNEKYLVNQKYKVLIKDVIKDTMGSKIIISRRDPKFIEALFKQEVPEMAQGTVKIDSIAREAGERTKVAVSSSDSKVDASGACIGQRGVRVQAVTDELNGEKIDVINYSPDADKFIASALAPAHVLDVILNHEEKSASVKVSDDQQSLAIGKEGENARLAAKLTGWRINVGGVSVSEAKAQEDTNAAESTDL